MMTGDDSDGDDDGDGDDDDDDAAMKDGTTRWVVAATQIHMLPCQRLMVL